MGGAPVRTIPTEVTGAAFTGRTRVVWYFIGLLPGGNRGALVWHLQAGKVPIAGGELGRAHPCAPY